MPETETSVSSVWAERYAMAVSYTHLDVYKRQNKRRFNFVSCFLQFIQSALFMIKAVLYFSTDRTVKKPNSETQQYVLSPTVSPMLFIVDVYKRQNQAFLQITVPVFCFRCEERATEVYSPLGNLNSPYISNSPAHSITHSHRERICKICIPGKLLSLTFHSGTHTILIKREIH